EMGAGQDTLLFHSEKSVVESYAEEEVDKSPDEGSLSSTADAGAAKADTSRSYSADAEDSDNNVGAGDNPMTVDSPLSRAQTRIRVSSQEKYGLSWC
ncbi:hypothetical protein KUCAC02_020083, partial [Chaenocephalus aceratus]